MASAQLIYSKPSGASVVQFGTARILAQKLERLRRTATLEVHGVLAGGCEKHDGRWIWWYDSDLCSAADDREEGENR